MSNSNLHVPLGLPILVAGRRRGHPHGGAVTSGIREGTPLSNLYQTLLNKLGVPVERIGDSTGDVQRAVSGVMGGKSQVAGDRRQATPVGGWPCWPTVCAV